MTDQPRTLAALKRAVRPGTRIKCLTHWRDSIPVRPDGSAPISGTVRTVTKAQGNAYVFTDTAGRANMWAYWPKAADVTFDGQGGWTQRYRDNPAATATYRLLPDGDAS